MDVAGPFQVLQRPLTLKPKDRKPPALGPKVRVEAVRASPVGDAASLAALVNGSGLADRDKDDLKEHDLATNSMWLGQWTTNLCLEFELAEPAVLSAVEVWNFNAEWQTTNGLRQASLAVSPDGQRWQTVLPDVQLAEAEGTADYDEPAILKLNGVKARKVRFEKLVPAGSSGQIGLSEVIFHEAAGARPCPVQPEDGARGVRLKNTVLEWSPVPGATDYRLSLGLAPDALRRLTRTDQPRFEVATLLPDTAYYWRVDAVPSRGKVVPGRVACLQTAGLMAWWKFDETEGALAADATGHQRRGRLKGSASWAPGQGRFGGALDCDGAGGHVNCDNPPEFDFRDELSVSVWLKVRRFDKPSQAIVTKGDNTWRLQRCGDQDTLEFTLDGPKLTPSSKTNRVTVVSQRSVNDGQWHHVVAAYDGRRVTLYVDGELEGAAEASGALVLNPGADLLIGENAMARRRFFNGWVDDVRLYGYGLSADEVRALYRGAAK